MRARDVLFELLFGIVVIGRPEDTTADTKRDTPIDPPPKLGNTKLAT